MKKKRYILFGYDQFYPCGGLDDVIETFNEPEYGKIKEKIKSDPRKAWGRYQIFDTETFRFTDGNFDKLPELPEEDKE